MVDNENSLEGMEEVIQEFLAESAEGLDQMENDLVSLEADPRNKELLANIFRAIHTIKGTCGFFGYSRLEAVTHVGESLLSRLRDGELLLVPEIATVLLSLVDAVREMLAAIESSGNDGEKTYGDLIEALEQLNTSDARSADAGSAPKERDAAGTPQPEKPTVNKKQQATAPASDDMTASADMQASPAGPGPDSAPQPAADQHEPSQASRGPLPITESAIRVDVEILDNLMNLVGELVLARNQILKYVANLQDPVFVGACQRLNLITSELQQDVMKTRMQPINNIWNKFPRVVRDLARVCGKKVEVSMTGKDTELDKSLIEAMKDPLTHLVRNAIDHGIETPDERVAKGKSPEGRVSLVAYHESGQVIVEIADDGAGINLKKVRDKAVELGLISAAQASQLGDDDIAGLIFAPGMTTSNTVTNISGRGVGMDVVRANLEKIGGFIEIDSVRDRGTNLRIQLPLTLAIIPALLVRSGNESFAIPQGSLLELIRIKQDPSRSSAIEMIHGVPVYRLRGKLLPLVYLNRELGLESTEEPGVASTIVVLQVDQRKFGLVVDAVEDSQEIVVKPLSDMLKAIAVYSGATITGNGRVTLILDVMGLAHRAKLLSENQHRFVEVSGSSSKQEKETQYPLIVAETVDGGRIAIPADSVVRLEEFRLSSLEITGNRTVVQYRGAILPLIELSDLMQERRRRSRRKVPAKALTTEGVAHVIVYDMDRQPIGMIVNRIQDIVNHSFEMEGPPTRHGTIGTVVIQGKVTEVFDAQTLKREVDAMRGMSRRAVGA